MSISRYTVFLKALAMVLFVSNSVLDWNGEVWEINGYVGWKFLEMHKEIIFYTEEFEPYPFVVE